LIFPAKENINGCRNERYRAASEAASAAPLI